MPITVNHVLTATTPDATSAEIRPSHWNSVHAGVIAAQGSEISGAFSNSPTVSFGMSGTRLTASAAGAPAVTFSAGTTSQSLSQVVFSNSNNVSFGLNGSTITASIANYLTTAMQSQSSSVFAATGFTTTTIAGAVVAGTHDTAGLKLAVPGYLTTAMASNAVTLSNINLSAGTTSNNLSAMTFSNLNGVTFGLNGSVVTASVAPPGAGSINISAGTTSNTFTAITFSNSNGVSFGLNGSTITGSVATSLTNVNVSAGTTSNNLSAMVFSNSNNVSFGLNGSTITGSINAGLTNVNVSAGTTSQNLSKFEFDNSNGVTFGLNGSTITGSVDATSSVVAGANITISTAGSTITIIGGAGGGGAALSAGTQSASSGTVVFSNSNGVTFGMSNSSVITASVSNQNVSLYALGNTTQNSSTVLNVSNLSFNGLGAQTVGYSNGSIQLSVPASSSLVAGANITISTAGSTISVIGPAAGTPNYSAGTTSNNLASVVFSNSNGVSFGLNGSTITGSVSQSADTIGLYASSQTTGQSSSSTVDARSISIVGQGNISVGLSAGSFIISQTGGGGGAGISAGTQSVNTGTVVFSNSNNITFGMSGSSRVTASYNFNFSAGTTSNNLNALTFSNSNNITFGLNGSTVTASYSETTPYLTTAMQSNAVTLSNIRVSAGTTSNLLSAITFSNSNNITFGLNGSTLTASYSETTPYLTTAMQSNAVTLSNIRVSAGTTSNLLSAITFSNSNNITFGLNGSTLTASYSETTPYLTTAAVSTVGLYAVGNTTSNSSTTLNPQTLSVNALGGMTAGYQAGSLLLSAPVSSSLSGGNFITISTNGSTISIIGASVAGQPINFSAGTTSNSLGSVVFSNSNGISFGLNGSTITAQLHPISYAILPADILLTQVSAPGNGSLSIQYVQPGNRISATRADILFNWSAGSSATTNTMAIALTAICGIYTLNGSTLSSVSSGSTQTTYSYASNSAGTGITGTAIRPISVPINVDMYPGGYYVAFGWSSAASSVGASTTAIGQTQSILGYPLGYTAANYAEWGNNTASSIFYIPGEGIYSAAISTVPPAISLSAINQTGPNLNKANYAIVFRA